MVVLTATLASIGAAGVPGAGIVTLTLVLQTIGILLEGIALILGGGSDSGYVPHGCQHDGGCDLFCFYRPNGKEA